MELMAKDTDLAQMKIDLKMNPSLDEEADVIEDEGPDKVANIKKTS